MNPKEVALKIVAALSLVPVILAIWLVLPIYLSSRIDPADKWHRIEDVERLLEDSKVLVERFSGKTQDVEVERSSCPRSILFLIPSKVEVHKDRVAVFIASGWPLGKYGYFIYPDPNTEIPIEIPEYTLWLTGHPQIVKFEPR